MHLANRMRRVIPSEIRERMKDLPDRRIIHLGGGLPDPALFPVAAFAEACAAIFADPGEARIALQYAPSEGHGPLRDWLAAEMGMPGSPCSAANILVTNGSQQGLDLIAKLLIDRGDMVMVEMPSFIGALRAFDMYEPHYIGVPANDAGWAAAAPARFCYAGPDFRNPTGTTMTRAERETLLARSDAHDMPIVEDGCYDRLRYDGEDIPSLLALDIARRGGIAGSRVLYTGTFSKTLAPSLRVGWIVADAPVIRRLTLLKQASDLATSAFNQMLALRLARTILPAEIARARAAYRARRDAMLAALAAHMPPGVDWTRPEGGLYIWLNLPEHLDGATIALRALTECGVATISGAAFYPVAPVRNTLRLSFSLASEADATEAIARLGGLIGEMV
ncbi:MAG: PLP-dependent aminotransferase family protein [Sphingomonas bacterium]|nr:PLP-dependent aminotransferase family protein [Sphingomonas bacterium]